MPRKPTKLIGINNVTGDSRVFPSIQTAADYICGAGFAGDEPNNSSVSSLITRVSQNTGTAYKWTFIRVPGDASERPQWSKAIEHAAQIRGMANMVLEYATNPDATDIIAGLEGVLGTCRTEMEGVLK